MNKQDRKKNLNCTYSHINYIKLIFIINTLNYTIIICAAIVNFEYDRYILLNVFD